MRNLDLDLGGGRLQMVRGAAGSYRLSVETLLDGGLDEVFEFSSQPQYLNDITPPWLTLRVKNPEHVLMAAGTRITYRFRMGGIPAIWHSEITVWEPPYRFVYRQRLGPFRRWVHEHTFEPAGSRTLARDTVEYAVSGGRLVHDLFVGPALRRLFTYRHQRLKEVLKPA